MLPSEMLQRQVEERANDRLAESIKLAHGLLRQRRFSLLRRRIARPETIQEREYMTLVIRFEECVKTIHRKLKWSASRGYTGSSWELPNHAALIRAKMTKMELDSGALVKRERFLDMLDWETRL